MKVLYVDWSGDPGFKFRRASSRYLTVACITSLMPLSDILNSIRDRYGLGKQFYFHFADSSRFLKPRFFEELAQVNLRGIVLRVNKQRLTPEFRNMRGNELIGYFVSESIIRLPDGLIEKHVLLFDGSRKETSITRAVRIAVSAKLRSTDKPHLRQVAPRPAREEDGLQVADMLAGAAASEHLSDNVLLGCLQGKVHLFDYSEEKQNRPG
ncbi:MAG: DUF3800 domain-containing protein [Chloroflexi bacterium]|nr:DUF3800 domain-containing protein [Chloroflexota bacterium]MBU1660949.1 DUF3800 domain-containing protein [Chloroflexota bacterium]